MKTSLCIESVLPELDFYDRIKIAADTGFNAIEFWEIEGKDLDKIGKLAVENNIAIAACCAKETRAKSMNYPSSVVVKNMQETAKIVKGFGCDTVIVLAGDVEGKTDSQKNIIIDNLKRVADIAVKEDININIEGLNSIVDHKGYYLDSAYLGFEIIKCVDCEKIKYLYDVYHMQIMEGNIIDNVTKNIDLIGHFHFAGVPGRHELYMGELNYKAIIDTINKSSYDRYLGLEYFPVIAGKESVEKSYKYMVEGIS
ncbi:MAG: TIM barrel protein [Clostridia bacterium]|nr:TIM barrel protein [Clostridia bacterium]MDD4680801.1 TIM barrel protein [Clostridia bacterium]